MEQRACLITQNNIVLYVNKHITVAVERGNPAATGKLFHAEALVCKSDILVRLPEQGCSGYNPYAKLKSNNPSGARYSQTHFIHMVAGENVGYAGVIQSFG